MEIINVAEKFALLSGHWRPKVAARLNDQEVKLVKIQGEFPWHAHDRCEEMFFVWKGSMQLEYRHLTKTLHAGEFVVVPRGVEHRTLAAEEAEVLIFEPKDTRNTGDIVDPFFTAPMGEEV
ncbi:MAG: cupin domain-containing protein [Chthoniobacterales bacterium]|nr:cupin domain-containing protein [Chthoniobacterales bacterium]